MYLDLYLYGGAMYALSGLFFLCLYLKFLKRIVDLELSEIRVHGVWTLVRHMYLDSRPFYLNECINLIFTHNYKYYAHFLYLP